MSGSALHALSTRLGILDEYVDQTGREKRVTTDASRVAIVCAMGFDASSESAARQALDQLEAQEAGELLDPVQVIAAAEAAVLRLYVRPPADGPARARWTVTLTLEQGDVREGSGDWDGGRTIEAPVPEPVPPGYHVVRLVLEADGREWTGDQRLIVVPGRCITPLDSLGDERAFGIVANLYTLASARNWGIGDLGDLEDLVRWAGTIGAAFVGVNPLHAISNRGHDISPYSPLSRLYRNPIYLNVDWLLDAVDHPVRDTLRSEAIRAEVEALRNTPSLAYEQTLAVKRLALDALYRVQAAKIATDVDYLAYVNRAGESLRLFATWMAIAEHQHDWDWRRWPAELRDPSSPEVHAFATEHAALVGFHQWVQFEMDRQLARVGRAAREAGLAIGLYQDVAIGVASGGADTWAYRDLFVGGAHVGAPPDPYSAAGQNWGLPPMDPRALRRSGYRYFIDAVRSGLQHSGALRIDHVLGLFRLFWIPAGASGDAGVYVRYPVEEMLGILALESQRHEAIIVGEDLGTVPPEVPPTLSRWGLQGTRVLFFERDDHGFHPPHQYPPDVLATATTHDMAPLAGYWLGRDLDIRRDVGLLAADEMDAARDARHHDRKALVRLLRHEQLLAPDEFPAADAAGAHRLCAAVHGLMFRTSARMVGLSLDDLAGEIEPVNVPGVGPDKHPSWSRRMRRTVAELSQTDAVRELIPEGRSG